MKIEVTDAERKLFNKFLVHFGATVQFNMLLEEMAELSTAILHGMRQRGSKSHIIEEIADVYITLAQVKLIMEAMTTEGEETVDGLVAVKLDRMRDCEGILNEVWMEE